jgi:hypothetical protein
LPWTAAGVAATTVFLHLPNVTSDCAPTLNLALIILATSSEIIAAIPLEPAPRVFVINPAFSAPDGKRLGGINAKDIQPRIMPFRAEFGFREPVFRELFAAVSQVAKTAEAFLRSQLRPKTARELFCRPGPAASVFNPDFLPFRSQVEIIIYARLDPV